MFLTTNELDALVQHLRAQHPQDEDLKRVLSKAHDDLRARRAPRKASDLDVASARLARQVEAIDPTVYTNAAAAHGVKKPRETPALLKPGSALMSATTPEELLAAIGLRPPVSLTDDEEKAA